MRFLSLVPLALTALSFVPFSLSAATGASASDGKLVARKGSNPPCRHLITRDDWTCHCLAGFEGPSDGDISKECHCGDKENSGYGTYTDPVGLVHPYCYCKGAYQLYNVDKHKCECDDKCYSKTKSNGHLVCTPKSSTSSGSVSKRSKITLEQALKEREISDEPEHTIEQALKCTPQEKACNIKGAWVCTNIMSELATCGGCPGEALDCPSLPGIDKVRCVEGKCVIDSCAAGFAISRGPTSTDPSASDAYCAKTPHVSYFEVQHPL